MQYNSDPDSQDIVSLVGDMTGINTTAEIKQITRAVNEANKKIWSWIFDSYGPWQYEDNNQDDLPSAVASLVANQKSYRLPSEALTVKAVEYMNTNGDWTKLDSLPLDLINQHTSEKEWQDSPAEPRWYSVVGRIIKLYPASDASRTDALRIQFDRGAISFTSTDLSKEPGFVAQFHEAVAVGASYYIASNKSLKQVNFLRQRWMDAEEDIKDFYRRRWQEEFPPRMRQNDLVSEYM